MKYALIALAATTIFGGASARGGHMHHRRHDHPAVEEECVAPMVPRPCETIVKTILVEHTIPAGAHNVAPPTLPAPTTTTPAPTVPVIPVRGGGPAEPEITICPTPGVYTFPAETVVLTNTEYICVPQTTKLPPGVHTYGGVTTVVEKQTTFVCPVPVVETIDNKVTSRVTLTEFVCPTAGTYVINPLTTTITETVDCEYPEVTEYKPGTYVRPETVITITKTQVVVTCPYLETQTQEFTVVPVPKETSTFVPAKETTKEAPAPKPTTSSVAPAKPTEVLVPPHNGPLWAITYSPFVLDGSIKCKDAALVNKEMADIASKGFKSIRLYSPECDGLSVIAAAARKNGLKLILGVFIKSDGFANSNSELDQIIAWKEWDIVELFTVGNEALFQGFVSGQALANYINECRSKLRAAGYNGPVTTTEPLNILQANAGVLCGAMDVTGCNIHPYFNPDVLSQNAGDFVNGQIAEAKKACNKEVYVLEAGWPNSGNVNGKAVPSPSEQRKAFDSIRSTCPMDRIVVFTYQNDYWKQPGAFGVEQNFGASDVF
ncbi:glycoside hydrolase superfamily [Peziza echinospora]|nr:glycoside hydrolase superfamily [Peziza echinospora]